VVSGARPNLSTREAQKLEEFISEFQEVLATKSDDYGRTEFKIASTPATLVRSVSLFADYRWPSRLR
jgi:hypothetical protein